MAPVSAKTAHVRRHVGLLWSCDPLETEVGKRHLLFRVLAARGKQRVSLHCFQLVMGFYIQSGCTETAALTTTVYAYTKEEE